MTQTKFKIYENILCLETPSPTGGKWWDQGFGLGYTAAPLAKISRIKHGRLQGENRHILAVRWENEWVAVNLPRSDIFGLKARGLWPSELRAPYTVMPIYSDWMEEV